MGASAIVPIAAARKREDSLFTRMPYGLSVHPASRIEYRRIPSMSSREPRIGRKANGETPRFLIRNTATCPLIPRTKQQGFFKDRATISGRFRFSIAATCYADDRRMLGWRVSLLTRLLTHPTGRRFRRVSLHQKDGQEMSRDRA